MYIKGFSVDMFSTKPKAFGEFGMEFEQSITLEAVVAADKEAAIDGDIASGLFRVQLAARFDSMEVTEPEQVTFNGVQLEGSLLWGTFQEMLLKINPESAKQKIDNLKE